MTTYTINARKVFVVQKHTGSSLGAIGDSIKDHLVKNGNSILIDLASDAIRRDPKSDAILKESLIPLADAANKSIVLGLSAVQGVLSNPSELPTASISPGSAGSKSFNMDLGFGGFRTSGWDGLSESYKKKIRRGIQTRRRKNDTKKFWYERSAWDRPHDSNTKGGSNKSLHELLAASGFGRQPLKATTSNVMTVNGSESSVSFKSYGWKFPKVKPHFRNTKRGRVIVSGTRGDIFMPTKLHNVFGGALEDLYDLIYSAISSGEYEEFNHQLSELNLSSVSHPDVTKLLLANEYRRPFLSKAFSVLHSEVFRQMRTAALRVSSPK